MSISDFFFVRDKKFYVKIVLPKHSIETDTKEIKNAISFLNDLKGDVYCEVFVYTHPDYSDFEIGLVDKSEGEILDILVFLKKYSWNYKIFFWK